MKEGGRKEGRKGGREGGREEGLLLKPLSSSQQRFNDCNGNWGVEMSL
jgi:hypothetical protein